MGEINRSIVSLRIMGKELDPDEITELFQCVPTQTHRRGEKRNTKGKVIKTWKKGLWSLQSGEIDSSPLEYKINTLLSKITDDIEIWNKVTQNFEADLFCGIFLGSFNEGFELSPDILRKISDRGLKIGFDIYDNPCED